MRRPLVADTGGLLRALAARPDGRPAWPEFQRAVVTASSVVVPALVLSEVDYFLRDDRTTMRRLVAELLDPSTTYELEPVQPADLVRAVHLDQKFAGLKLGLVDAMVAAVAERRGIYRILTTDRADFTPLRVGERFHRALTVVP